MSDIKQLLQGTYENHVLPFLWQKGESQEIIKDYLHKIRNSDIKEICLESRPHPDFCGPGWWDDVRYIIEECKKLDMKIWLLDDSHFPTGYANGMIKDRYPEHKKTVLTHRTMDVIGPQKITIQLRNIFDPTETFYGAFLHCGNDIQDISHLETSSKLTVDIPCGIHQVTLVFTSRKTTYNEDYINMVDKESCQVLIQAVYEPHYEQFKEEFGKTILGFFSDEPGFMNEKGVNADSLIGKEDMVLPWSLELERRFKEAMKEDYACSLPLLWMPHEKQAYVRHVYMDIATTLYKECFDEALGTWCRERGVMHIGHVIEDKDSHARLGVGAGHYFRALAGQDMAGVDIVINQLVPGMDEGYHSYGRGKWDMEFFNYALAKLGSSLAHVDPLKQGRCMAEVFGAFGWHEGLKEMKWIADHFLVRGVNYYVPHAFSQAPFPDWDCPPHFYAHGQNPQFRYFKTLMTYLNKMSTLISDGTPHPTAAILYHAEAEWAGSFMPIQKVAKELTRNQIDFTFIPCDVFQDTKTYQTKLDEEGLHINGITYACFILPYCEYIGQSVYQFMKEAHTVNFPMYVIDQLPDQFYDAQDQELDVSFVNVVPLSSLVSSMHQQGLYEIKCDQYEPWLRYYHYTKEHCDASLFVNEHPKKCIQTRIPGLKGTLIDVMNDELYAVDEVLSIEPYEAFVFVPECLTQQKKEQYNRKKLNGEWRIQYASSVDYPNFTEANTITSLQDAGLLYPEKAGTFRYEIEVVFDGTQRELFLEEAYETVEVFIDHQSIAHRIAPPYRFPLPPISEGTHLISIDVTNTLDKQMVDMFTLSEPCEPSGIIGNVWIG